MNHVTLCCACHPHLRWSCKEIAWTPASADPQDLRGAYNGFRNLHYLGPIWGGYEAECPCAPSLLRRCDEAEIEQGEKERRDYIARLMATDPPTS